jgi:peroxiredoxin/predicted 2-oxoglutarate/Fe(II)-dependent dioxygenase YbiX
MEIRTKTLTNRDPAPLFNLVADNGKNIILRDHAGKPLVIFFYGKNELPSCKEILLGLRDRFSEFQQLNAKILAISLDNPSEHAEFVQTFQIPFNMLSDANFHVSNLYGVCYEQLNGEIKDLIYTRSIFVLDPNLQIAQIFTQENTQNPIESTIQFIRTYFPPQPPIFVPMQAPVLIIPNVIAPDLCRHLIDVWETQGHSDSGFMKRDGEKTVGYVDHSFKVREDHFISDQKLKAHLDWIMTNRLFPQIKKAFEYQASRREEYKIAMYTAENGGFFRPHRDNTSGGTAHRKFAMTLNLNTEEYDGGYLQFPEYGSYQYRPETGSAVIFNCSLLHEATDVLKGRRFALLNFFYGEEEAIARQNYEAKVENDYTKVVVKTSA